MQHNNTAHLAPAAEVHWHKARSLLGIQFYGSSTEFNSTNFQESSPWIVAHFKSLNILGGVCVQLIRNELINEFLIMLYLKEKGIVIFAVHCVPICGVESCMLLCKALDFTPYYLQLLGNKLWIIVAIISSKYRTVEWKYILIILLLSYHFTVVVDW